ncbi:MAG: helix-turn-helix transcriptional regulator [Rhodospirillales bacterium]|nr:helix-turn-helix transcriptional regulator [Rhodospirillales bacterium]
MLRHADIWQAIDQLASTHGFSPSGLARRAGLDPTTFNKSKRVARDGRPRWPSTESIAKILEATEATLGEFVGYIGATPAATGAMRRIPVVALAQAAAKSYFDDSGHPTGPGWDELLFPEISDPHAYALEIGGDGMQPVYRDGDTIIVSPAASLRRSDRVVIKTAEGELLICQFLRRGSRKVELLSFGAAQADLTLPVENVAFVHRIVWASQ